MLLLRLRRINLKNFISKLIWFENIRNKLPNLSLNLRNIEVHLLVIAIFFYSRFQRRIIKRECVILKFSSQKFINLFSLLGILKIFCLIFSTTKEIFKRIYNSIKLWKLITTFCNIRKLISIILIHVNNTSHLFFLFFQICYFNNFKC